MLHGAGHLAVELNHCQSWHQWCALRSGNEQPATGTTTCIYEIRHNSHSLVRAHEINGLAAKLSGPAQGVLCRANVLAHNYALRRHLHCQKYTGDITYYMRYVHQYVQP